MSEKVRTIRVGFSSVKLRETFESLRHGKFEDRALAKEIDLALDTLKVNPQAGVLIPYRLWPAYYLEKFNLQTLRKFNLRNGWRLIYTLEGSDVYLLVIILEWFSHKNYEKRFGYKVR